MGKIINVPLAVHRLDMAGDAIVEIGEVSDVLLAYISAHDVTRNVTALSQGMLSRVKALCNIISECIASDEDERRPDDEIRSELTGLPTAGPGADAGASDADEAGEPVAAPAAAAPAQPEPTAPQAPTTEDPVEVARTVLAGLRAWRLLLPTDTDHINKQAASTPQLVLRTIIECLEGTFDGPGNDLPARQAAALLQTVEAELWKVSTFELESVSVEWCTRVVGLASTILQAAVQAPAREDEASGPTSSGETVPGVGTACAAPADDGEGVRQLQGGIAFYELLRELAAVPDYLLAGKTPDEDNSTAYGLHVAQDLLAAVVTRCGLQVADPALAGGFMGCMARYVINDIKGYSLGYGDSAEEDAREALADVAEARLGTPLGVSHG